MPFFTVKVTSGELGKTLREISAWDGKSRLKVETVLRKGTTEIAREARQRAPKRTGTLRKSIKQRFSAMRLEGQVFSELPYAHLVEFGSRAHTVRSKKKRALHFFKEQAVFAKKVRIPARAGKPFLKPSYDYVEPSIIDRVKKAMKEP